MPVVKNPKRRGYIHRTSSTSEFASHVVTRSPLETKEFGNRIANAPSREEPRFCYRTIFYSYCVRSVNGDCLSQNEVLEEEEHLQLLKKTPPFRIDPEGTFKAKWDVFMLFLVYYVSLVTPLNLAFFSNESTHRDSLIEYQVATFCLSSLLSSEGNDDTCHVARILSKMSEQ